MIKNKISIITPCYNMEKYIEKTILSVINQGYANLEYIIVDGGSTDRTLEIINKYKDHITLVISEKDNGMYDAIHKGFARSTGSILAWLNADDQYFPWAFNIVNEIFCEFPNINWICGISAFSNQNGDLTRIYTHPGSKPRNYIKNGWFREDVCGYLDQDNMFWSRELYFKVGGLKAKYKFAGDFDLWNKFAIYSELVSVNIPFAVFLRRKDSLSIGGKTNYLKEVELCCQGKKKYPTFFWYLFPSGAGFNKILRFLTFKKSYLLTLPFVNEKMRLRKVIRPVSNNTLSELIYEII